MINEENKLTKEFAGIVCRMGEGEFCCSFLAMDKEGLTCLKNTKYAEEIIHRRLLGTMKAKGDNCSGPPNFQVAVM